MRTQILSSALALFLAGIALSAEPVQEVSWTSLKKSGQWKAGQVDREGWLRVDAAPGKRQTVAILEMRDLSLSSPCYALQGKVRYENLAEGSYLEMWSTFADGSRYFTRTMAPSGLLQELKGNSAARPFVLPFLGSEKTGPPRQLELNIVFADGGTVWLSPLRLIAYAPGEDPLQQSGAWWGDRTAAWIGSIGGSVIGLLGAMLGVLASLTKARRFVFLMLGILFACGLVCLAVGVVAVALSQPYAVYYPLLLIGVILTGVFGFSFPVIRRRYQAAELRRMQTMDLGGISSAGRAPS